MLRVAVHGPGHTHYADTTRKLLRQALALSDVAGEVGSRRATATADADVFVRTELRGFRSDSPDAAERSAERVERRLLTEMGNLPPNTMYVYWSFVRDQASRSLLDIEVAPLGSSWRAGHAPPSSAWFAATSAHDAEAQLVRTMTSYVRALAGEEGSDPVADASRWDNSAEELIRRVHVVLEDPDRLLTAWAQAYDRDLRTARARVTFLENQLAALEAERLATPPQWRDPTLVATAAVAIFTLMAPLLAVLLNHALEAPVRDVVEQSTVVIRDCGGTPGAIPRPVEP